MKNEIINPDVTAARRKGVYHDLAQQADKPAEPAPDMPPVEICQAAPQPAPAPPQKRMGAFSMGGMPVRMHDRR
jgi:hypothetical protein